MSNDNGCNLQPSPSKINAFIYKLINRLHIVFSYGIRPVKILIARAHKSLVSSSYRYGLLVIILLLLLVPTIIIKANTANNQDIQSAIADEIIRFHVIANSDSDKDQALKLIVKDTLVENLRPYLDDASSIEDAREILSNNISYINDLAETTIQEQGYNYSVKVSLEECYFPLKVYGEYSFPPGNYEALRVQIGDAKGKNWWCVMFPPLCFVDETYSIVDESSDQKLKYLLSEEEYDSLKAKNAPVKIKFKLFEKLKNLFRQ